MVCKKRKSPRDQDTVTILSGERTWVFKAWDQGALPHEVVHFGVEQAYGIRGFVRLIAAGLSSEDILSGGADEEAVHAEFLTSAHQYELGGLSEPTNEAFRELLASFQGKGASGPPEVSDEQIAHARDVLLDLAGRWGALALGESLELSLPLEVG
jgi:hypothetical protein